MRKAFFLLLFSYVYSAAINAAEEDAGIVKSDTPVELDIEKFTIPDDIDLEAIVIPEGVKESGWSHSQLAARMLELQDMGLTEEQVVSRLNFEQVQERFDLGAIGNFFLEILDPVFDAIDIVKEAIQSVIDGVTSLPSALSGAAGIMVSTVNDVVTAFTTLLGDTFDAAQAGVDNMISRIGDVGDALADTAGDIAGGIGNAGTAVVGFMTTIKDNAVGAMSTGMDAAGSLVTDLIGNINSAFDGMGDVLAGAAEAATDAFGDIKDDISSSVTLVTGTLQNAVDDTLDFIDDAVDTAGDAVNTVSDFVEDAVVDLTDTLSEAFSNAVDFLGSVFSPSDSMKEYVEYALWGGAGLLGFFLFFAILYCSIYKCKQAGLCLHLDWLEYKCDKGCMCCHEDKIDQRDGILKAEIRRAKANGDSEPLKMGMKNEKTA